MVNSVAKMNNTGPLFEKAIKLMMSNEESSGDELLQLLDDKFRTRYGSVTARKITNLSKKCKRKGRKPSTSKQGLPDSGERSQGSSNTSDTSDSDFRAFLMCDEDMSAIDQDEAEENNLACSVSPKTGAHHLIAIPTSFSLTDHFIITPPKPEKEYICNICKELSTIPRNRGIACMQCHSYYHKRCVNPPVKTDVTDPEFMWFCQTCTKQLIMENNLK